MPKITYILAAMLLCVPFFYGQNITFHENVNYRASVLDQHLDNDKNLLFLESKNDPITHIEIFNDTYSKSINVNDTKTSIDLNTLPVGNFVIQAKVDTKFIIMYIEKTGSTVLASNDIVDKSLEINPTTTLNSIKNIEKSEAIYYWVVYESNSNFGSSSKMSLEYKDAIFKIISKHKLELKSNVAKSNKLLIYEVFKKSEFMDKQFRNPTYYKSDDASKFLNTKPLYVSSNDIEDDF